MSKSGIICCARNVGNHAIFVEGFWVEFYARGRFMKYSMSEYYCEILYESAFIIGIVKNIKNKTYTQIKYHGLTNINKTQKKYHG